MAQFYSQFGGGGDTNMSVAGFICIAIAFLLMFFLSRKYVIRPVLVVAFLIPTGQAVVVGGLHFLAIRIILIAAWATIVFGKRQERPKLNALDWAFILWTISSVVMFTILWKSSEAFINRAGSLYTAIGVYFFFRYFLRDFEDIDNLIRFLSVITAILAVGMLIEQLAGRNLFSLLFGGLWVGFRDGKVRAQGAFGNCILAGSFGATTIPFFLGSWSYLKRARFSAGLGAISAVIIILTCNSSTPVMALGAVIVGFALWPLRGKMRLVRWAIVLGLCGLALVMKAPVWALIGRLDVLGGSAQQRQALVDGFMRHISDWFWVGSRNYASWNWYSVDLDNQYVYEGTTGGIFTLGFFIATIVYAFKLLGNARKAVAGSDRNTEWRLWTLGVALFAQMTAFMGISYFDNSIVGWFALLAMIQAAAATVLATSPAQEQLAPTPVAPLGRSPAPVPAMPKLARSKLSKAPALSLNKRTTTL